MTESTAELPIVADDAVKEESVDAIFTQLASSAQGLSDAEAEKAAGPV